MLRDCYPNSVNLLILHRKGYIQPYNTYHSYHSYQRLSRLERKIFARAGFFYVLGVMSMGKKTIGVEQEGLQYLHQLH